MAGSGNSILNSRVSGWAGAGIAVEPGVAYTTIANNEVFGGVGEGIRSSGATRTTIINNTVENRCRDLIRVDGASTGASVQNNIAFGSVADFESFCGASTPGVIDIGVHDGAMADTIVDYNTVYNFRYTLPQVYYAWGDTAVDGNAFRAASGQGAHDYERGDAAFVIDSANSAAPGFQATDAVGHPREDDPGLGNGGVGPISYADRGALEEVKAPTAQLTFTLGPIPGVFIADASASTAGFAPIGSYRFDFGDGIVVTQPNPVCWHRYTRVGTYWLTVTVVSSDGLSGYKLQTVGVRSVVRIWHGARLNAVVTRSAGSFPAL